MNSADITLGLIWYVVFLYSTVCHEAAHAWMAHRLGDDTAYRGGQVSLDPIPHIRREPFGMVVVPLLSFVLGGWMIGWASAPYDPAWAERHPKRDVAMSLAGPAANLVLVLFAAIMIRAGIMWGVFAPPDLISASQMTQATGGRMFEFLAVVVSITFSLNLLLFTFNLLPLPPLDGSSVPFLFLPRSAADKYREILWNPTVRLFGLLVAWHVFGAVYPVVASVARALLYPGIVYA